MYTSYFKLRERIFIHKIKKKNYNSALKAHYIIQDVTLLLFRKKIKPKIKLRPKTY